MRKKIKEVKIHYEYLTTEFNETAKGGQTHFDSHIDDNGDVIYGEWVNVWCSGTDIIPEDSVNEYIAARKGCKTIRNITVER